MVNVLRDMKWVYFDGEKQIAGSTFRVTAPKEYPRKYLIINSGNVRMCAAKEGVSLQQIQVDMGEDQALVWLDANVSSSKLEDISFRGFNFLNTNRHPPHLTQDRTAVGFVIKKSPTYAIMINQDRMRGACVGPAAMIVAYEDNDFIGLLNNMAEFLSGFTDQPVQPDHIMVMPEQWANRREIIVGEQYASVIYHGWFSLTRDCPKAVVNTILYEPGIRPTDIVDIVEQRSRSLTESRYISLVSSETVMFGYMTSSSNILKFVIDEIDKKTGQIHIQQYAQQGIGVSHYIKFVPSNKDWHRVETSWGSYYNIEPFLMSRVGIMYESSPFGRFLALVSDSAPPHVRLDDTRGDPLPQCDWLYPYQKETVANMIKHERMEDGTVSLFATRINGLPFQEGVFRLGNGSVSVYVPIDSVSILRKTYGMLCDEPGMGKTRQILGLIKETYDNKATIVVVLPAVMLQWKREIEEVWPECKLYIHHGKYRKSSIDTSSHIVLTTYNMVAQNMDLFSAHQWHRAVLDESHTISPAIFRSNVLNAQHKWCVTATPEIHLKQQMVWLTRGHDWHLIKEDGTGTDRHVSWNNIGQHDMTLILFWKMLRPIMFRKSIDKHFKFPSVTQETVMVRHTDQERHEYDKECTKIRQMDMYYRSFPASIGIGPRCTRWFIHLENVCNGVQSTIIDDDHSTCDIVNHTKRIPLDRMPQSERDGEEETCPICISGFQNPVMTGCNHFFCLECLNVAFGRNQKCPYCRTPIKPRSCYLVDSCDQPERKRQREDDRIVPDTKMQRILEDVTRVLESNRTSKILIFFNSPALLKKYETIMSETIRDTQILSVHGLMNISKRSHNISKFQKEDTECRILLLTVKCASAGINLTRADHVLLTSPVSQASLEDQMIGRSKRIGQKSDTIKYVRYVYDDTIESRLLHHNNGQGAHINIIGTL